jgi:hypothetical protein
MTAADETPPDLGWIAPGHHGTPAQTMARLRAICAAVPDLHGACLAALATHQGLPREILAAALLQCRPDARAYKREDMVSLLTALHTGGREAFEAVQRSRRTADRKAAAMPWVKD